jgi:acylphosphatase
MKLKIIIVGPKVHDVGYRYFLMSTAMDISLSGFHARNRTEGNEQEVITLVEGDESEVADFKSLVETKRPVGAEVSSVAFEEYHGTVMPAGQYAQVCSALQLNKAIPVLLEIRDSSKAMLEKQDQTLVVLNEMNSKQDKMLEKQDQTLVVLNEMNSKQDKMLEKQDQTLVVLNEMNSKQDKMLEKQDKTIEEIKGLREDVRPGLVVQIQNVQSDVRAIKDRLGMP